MVTVEKSDRYKRANSCERGAHAFTMVTTEPNERIRTYHDRMPVVLPLAARP
jgi:putative SOS response-associated peptidase YedK